MVSNLPKFILPKFILANSFNHFSPCLSTPFHKKDKISTRAGWTCSSSYPAVQKTSTIRYCFSLKGYQEALYDTLSWCIKLKRHDKIEIVHHPFANNVFYKESKQFVKNSSSCDLLAINFISFSFMPVLMR